jgi:uncharacterized BrkB/YihY/UPF0761 family membrane protein
VLSFFCSVVLTFCISIVNHFVNLLFCSFASLSFCYSAVLCLIVVTFFSCLSFCYLTVGAEFVADVGESEDEGLCFDFPLFSVVDTNPDELMLAVRRFPRLGPIPEPEFRREVPEK